MTRSLHTMTVVALVTLAVSNGVSAEPGHGPDYEQLRALEWLIGDWEAEWTVPAEGTNLDSYSPGATVHSTFSSYWMENRNYIGIKLRDVIDDTVAYEGFEMVGVDPTSKKPIHWIFSMLGGYGTGEWSKDGDKWILSYSGATADGTAYEGTSVMVSLDHDTHTWQIRETKTNNEPTHGTPLVTFRRRPSTE